MLPRELEVPLIVGGHGHDRAGAVLHQHVGRYVDRHALAVDRVHRVHPQGHAFLRVGGLAISQRGRRGALHQRPDVLPRAGQLGQAPHGRVLDREHEERHAPQGVGTRREDGDHLPRLLDRERDARALAAPDPVPLHRDDPLGPLREVVHVVEQPLRVIGDLEEPLREVAPLHHHAAPLAGPRDHLLVRQHGLVLRAPVDRRGLAIGQPALEQPQEQPLGPPVVLRIAGGQAARPVERHPHPIERGGLLLDVGVGPRGRGRPALDRRVLGWQPERVPPDGVQHVVSAHPPIASDHVPTAERLDVAHVHVARGIREHVQGVEPRPRVRRVVGGRVETLLPPDPLPPGLDLGRVVSLGHRPQMVTDASLPP